MRACPRCKTPYRTQIDFCALDGERLVDRDVDPLIGATFDRYRIVERLGGGGMAAVYRAAHNVIDRQAALKVLYGELASDAAFAERFRREAWAASRIKHDNVVAVLDFGVTPEGATFILMELVEGRTLSAVLGASNAGKLEPPRAARLLRDVAVGLAAAHAEGFVHRDLKPSNVMIVDDKALGRERAKILDFGLVSEVDAHAAASGGALIGEAPSSLTKTGQFVGTPAYMSPEQIRGQKCTERSDLYSLGVILYEMLAGRRPFQGTATELLGQHVGAPPPALAPAGGLEKLALRLLDKKPTKRPVSAAEVVHEIDRLGLVPSGEKMAALPRGQRTRDAATVLRNTLTSPLSSKLGRIKAAAIGAIALLAVIIGINKYGDDTTSVVDADGGVATTIVDGGRLITSTQVDGGTGTTIVDASIEAAREKAADDVAAALKWRGFLRNDARAMTSLRDHFGRFDAARAGNDVAALRAATATLLREIGRADVPARMVTQQLDRVAKDLKTQRAKLSKKERALFQQRLDALRGRARRNKANVDAEWNLIYADAVALERKINE